MDPFTATAITTVVTQLAAKAFDAGFETSVKKFTEHGLHWLKSLFWNEDKPTPVLQQLVEKPDSVARQQAVAALIAIDLEDHPEHEQWLKEIVGALEATGGINVSHSKNVVTSHITAGGSVIVGDSNTLH
jgi:hypothetical protein